MSVWEISIYSVVYTFKTPIQTRTPNMTHTDNMKKRKWLKYRCLVALPYISFNSYLFYLAGLEWTHLILRKENLFTQKKIPSPKSIPENPKLNINIKNMKSPTKTKIKTHFKFISFTNLNHQSHSIRKKNHQRKKEMRVFGNSRPFEIWVWGTKRVNYLYSQGEHQPMFSKGILLV